MRRRALAAAVAGWVTVVGATSAVAWVAIDHAGREVLTTPAAPAGAAGVSTGVPRTPDVTVGTIPARSSTTTHTGLATKPPETKETPTTARSRSSTRSSSSTTAPPTRASTAAPPPSAVDRTVRVEGGEVGVRCVGRTASLQFAQPANGWSVKLDDAGPEQVKVKFTSSADGRDIEVEARCSNGTPTFSTSDDDLNRDTTPRR